MQLGERARPLPKPIKELSDRELAEYQAVLTADIARSLRELTAIVTNIKIPSLWLKNKH